MWTSPQSCTCAVECHLAVRCSLTAVDPRDCRYVRVVKASSASYGPCEVVSSEESVRAPLGCVAAGPRESALETSFQIARGVTTVVVGAAQPLDPAVEYDVWFIASDYSNPPNLQV